MIPARNSLTAWVAVSACATVALLARTDDAYARSRGSAIGAGAAGLAVGLILGGMANQSRAAPSEQASPQRRVYRKTNTNNRSTGSGTTSTSMSREETERVQEALNLLGYDVGTVDGSMGRKTQQAISAYQESRGWPKTGRLNTSERQMLFADMKAKQNTASNTRGTDPNPEPAKPDPRLELAHWETVKNSKLPAELEDYITRYPSGEFSNLARLRLEQIKSEIAKADEAQRPTGSIRPPTTATAGNAGGSTASNLPPIDAAAFPRARQRRTDAVAVVIGNSTYGNDVPKVEYSIRDAEAMKLLAARSLGLDESNIIFLKDATRGAMDKVFGTDKDHKGELWKYIDPDGRSDVFVFYSGHGMPGINDTKDNFLMPVDGDPQHANLNGYPLSLLYKNLGELKTKSTTVFLDACFSGQSPDGNSTPLLKHASPVFISKPTPSDATRINVFSAASERQLSSWDTTAGHGIFTRFVLQGLSGEADEDKNKEITAKELSEYVGRQVRRTARRTHGREQEPQFSGNPDFVIATF